MKRIAIVTITNGGSNFGNRLQNYALQASLERLGCEAETIFTAKAVRGSLALSRLRWTARKLIKRTKRQYYFDAFDRRYIHAAPRTRYQGLNDGDFALDNYDAALAGSDQLWNLGFPFNSDFEFLPFMPPEKRYSYAASFGTDEVPPARRAAVADFLRDMKEISVREEAGRAIVGELTGRDALVHVDPTLLLQPADYEPLMEKPPLPLPERYLLTYLRYDVSEACRSFISQTAEELGLAVVALNERRENPLFNIGPQHFLHLVKHAAYVCSTSFHGTVFSILYHRPFTCIHRQTQNGDFNSRLDTLLNITGLGSRLYREGAAPGAPAAIDYAAVDEALAAQRAKAMEYLQTIAR